MRPIKTVVAILAVTCSGMLLAQEHPTATKAEHPKAPAATATVAKEHPAATATVAKEHPAATATVAKEHPEHPKGVTKKFSIDELETAIKRDVAVKQKAGGGYLKLKDPTTKKTWLLKLDHVHRERLSQLDAHTYFACNDFKSKDGHLVDVDFFEKEKNGKLTMSDMTIHKVDGKARYGWEEKNGFWVKVPAAK